MEYASALAGFALLVISPMLLAQAWRRGAAERMARLAGWFSLALAMAAFGFAFGPMRGPVLMLILFPLPALALIAIRRDRSIRRASPERTGATAEPQRVSRALARFFVAALLPAIAAVLVAAQIARLFSSMSASMSGGVVAGLAIGVLLWSVGIMWAVTDPHLRRPASGLALAALAGAIPLVLS